jgi:hypothetical protein
MGLGSGQGVAEKKFNAKRFGDLIGHPSTIPSALGENCNIWLAKLFLLCSNQQVRKWNFLSFEFFELQNCD